MTTAPDKEAAEHLAKHLVEHGMAACVNISGEITSVYRWQGKLEQGTEHQLTIKTTPARYQEVERLIREKHSYELPEILAIPVSLGLPAYLEWVNTCTCND